MNRSVNNMHLLNSIPDVLIFKLLSVKVGLYMYKRFCYLFVHYNAYAEYVLFLFNS